jgi:hypothetical protein
MELTGVQSNRETVAWQPQWREGREREEVNLLQLTVLASSYVSVANTSLCPAVASLQQNQPTPFAYVSLHETNQINASGMFHFQNYSTDLD